MKKALLLSLLIALLSSCGGGGGGGGTPAEDLSLAALSATRTVPSIDGFNVYRLSSATPKIDWSSGPWKKATLSSIKIDPSATVMRMEIFLNQVQSMAIKEPKGNFKGATAPDSGGFGILLNKGNVLTFGNTEKNPNLTIPIFLARDGTFNIEKTDANVSIKKLKTSKGKINISSGKLVIDTAFLEGNMSVTGTAALEFSGLTELPGEYLYQDIILDDANIAAKDRPILNKNRLILRQSMIQGNIVNEKLLVLTTKSRLFGNVTNKGEMNVVDSSIAADIDNQGNISFQNVNMMGDTFTNSKTVSVSGGNISSQITNSGKFECMSDGIPMSGDFVNETGGTFIPRSADMSGGILTNHGNMHLDFPIQVKKFFQPTKGEISIVLSDTTDPTVPYVQASQNITLSGGKIYFSYKGKKQIKKDARYKIFSAGTLLSASIKDLTIDYLPGDLIQVDTIKAEKDGKDYILTFLKTINKPKKGVHFALSRGRNAFHSYMASGAHFNGERMNINQNLSFIYQGETLTQKYTFMAMDYHTQNASYGVYTGYHFGDEAVMDAGVYGVKTLGALKFLHNLHVSQVNQRDLHEKFYAFGMYNEISLPFKAGHMTVSPKILASHHKVLSSHDEYTSWSLGAGLDFSSKLTLYSMPFEIFSSFNFVRENEYGDQNNDEMTAQVTIGFKGEISESSNCYGHFKMWSEDQKVLEGGLELRF